MISYTVFVVDDEATIREGIAAAFGSRYGVKTFPDAESALAAVREEPPDLVLLDIGLPGMSGLDALREIRALDPEILVVVITAFEDVRTVVSAMKGGAHDYVVKPLQLETLDVCVRNALETVGLKKEVRLLQDRLLQENLPCFIGESDTIQDVMEFVNSVAKSPDTPVLILGETGTGKELIAGAVHFRSPNFRGPLVSVNCAAIPQELIESELFGYEKGAFTGASASGKKGRVEEAAGGTLFLDEVGDLSLQAQAKLLRFLEEGAFYRVGGTRRLSVATRVVSATNKDLWSQIEAGLFREDLFYRLAVVSVKVPSLSERAGDILPIARHYLLEFSRKFGKSFTGFSPEAEGALLRWPWKGNVRELKNVMERAVLSSEGPVLSETDLGLVEPPGRRGEGAGDRGFSYPPLSPDGIDFDAVQASLERYYFESALRMTAGNESRAASLLNLNHHTFRYRKRKLDR